VTESLLDRVAALEAAVVALTRRLDALEARSPGQYEPGSEPDATTYAETED